MAGSREVNLGHLSHLRQSREDDDDDGMGPPQRGPSTGRRRGSACRNPECRGGLTPGVQAIGKGKSSLPLFGDGGTGGAKLMRWGWVPCLACNAPDGSRRAGAIYRPLSLSDEEIARRAELATAKAHYTEPKLQDKLGGLRRPTSLSPGSAHHARSEDSNKLNELLDANKKLSEQVTQLTSQLASQGSQFATMNETMSRMTMQIASLLEDNAKLRKELDGNKQEKPG